MDEELVEAEELVSRLKSLVDKEGWPKRSGVLVMLSEMLAKAASCNCEGCQAIMAALLVAQSDVTANFLLYGEIYSPEGINRLAQGMTSDEFADVVIEASEASLKKTEPSEEPVGPNGYEYYWGPKRETAA